ncbi:glycosyltransferase [Flavobacterium sp. TP390]|uniref:Glycosyltransferase n=1 Tax=Flavobacterium profundi TaxID=1774945 RepID=A0A6I4IV73_9FLAO|nr:glycosyltransferase [Flavobacterium profundi]MVO10786.1 glycosyltransferase [Flavobacterium profundi]
MNKNKTFVDLFYVTFSFKKPEEVLKRCYSTVGYLEKLATSFNLYFVARTTEHSLFSEDKPLKAFLFKGKKLKKWMIPFRFNWFIKSLQPNYILVHGLGFVHYLIFLKAILPKSKILLQSNGFAPKPKGIKKYIYKVSDNFIDGYLFTGIENAKPWYENKIFTKDKIFSVMEGSTHFKFSGNEKRKPNSFLWVGRLDANKDPLTILKAFERFLDIEENAILTMIFHENHLLSQIQDFISNSEKLKKAVLVKGFVEHHLLEEIYNENEFFILGSHYEGSGYALVESMACGCIPVVTNIAPFRYMTNDGACAYLFTPNREDELFCQLKRTRDNDLLILQKKVLEQFKNKLSFEAIANDIMFIFKKIENESISIKRE